MKIVIVSGGFDPVHSGHIKLINAARHLGDMLIVGINSDEWLARKKGRAFMPWPERLCVLNNLKAVDEVYTFDDEDDTACNLLHMVKVHYPDAEIVFANGGDRTRHNIPEMTVPGVEFVFGVGGEDKANSSSWILEEWKAPQTKRPWGYYRVLHELPGTKVKELTVEPGQTLSMQRHQSRAEYWHIAAGRCMVENATEERFVLNTHSKYLIGTHEWHRLYNPFTEPCKIVEIQYGSDCAEEDIERR
jgi:cytidyltransferase-like protein